MSWCAASLQPCCSSIHRSLILLVKDFWFHLLMSVTADGETQVWRENSSDQIGGKKPLSDPFVIVLGRCPSTARSANQHREMVAEFGHLNETNLA